MYRNENIMWDAQFEYILRAWLPFLPEETPITADLNLRDAGLDSLGTVDLLFSVENSYDVKFTDSALDMETFATADSLWRTISELKRTAEAR
ncbi:phosphopantetheine-binding protein [Streptomyces sp. NPDC093510]|uniref:phosphopantetheine-binding protein n=1 Tax=Streptomyces sp. NPDC093510 TaxID=3155199 RepID=UPI003424BE53